MTEKNHNTGLRFALLLTVFCALGPFTLDMYLSAFPQIVHSFGTTATLVQTSLTAGLVGLAFGQVVIGTLSDSHGRRKPLLFSMIVYALSSLGCALAPTIEIFLALRFVQGFAGSAGLVIARAMVRDRMSGLELTKFFALLSTVNSAAPLLSPLVGGVLVGFVSWQGVFVFTALVGLYLTLVTLWKVEETLPVERRVRNHVGTILQNYRELLTHRTFVGYALASGVLYAGMFGYIAASPFVFQNLYGLSPQVFSVVFALNGVGIMVGAQVVRLLAGRVSERGILKLGMALNTLASVAVLVLVIFHGPLIPLIVGLFALNLALGIVGPISFRLAIESQRHVAGTASAILGVLPFLLGAVASPLAGLAGEFSALPLGLLVLGCNLLALGFLVTLTRRSSQN